LVVPTDLPLPL